MLPVKGGAGGGAGSSARAAALNNDVIERRTRDLLIFETPVVLTRMPRFCTMCASVLAGRYRAGNPSGNMESREFGTRSRQKFATHPVGAVRPCGLPRRR